MFNSKKLLAAVLSIAILAAGCAPAEAPSSKASEASTPSSVSAPSSSQAEEKSERLVEKDTELTVVLGESTLVPVSQDMTHFKYLF